MSSTFFFTLNFFPSAESPPDFFENKQTWTSIENSIKNPILPLLFDKNIEKKGRDCPVGAAMNELGVGPPGGGTGKCVIRVEEECPPAEQTPHSSGPNAHAKPPDSETGEGPQQCRPKRVVLSALSSLPTDAPSPPRKRRPRGGSGKYSAKSHRLVAVLHETYSWLRVRKTPEIETGLCEVCQQPLVLNRDTCEKHEKSERHNIAVARKAKQPSVKSFLHTLTSLVGLELREECVALLLAAKSVPLSSAPDIFSDEMFNLLRSMPEFPGGKKLRRRLEPGFSGFESFLKEKLRGQPYALQVDETKDRCWRGTINVVLSTWEDTCLIGTEFTEDAVDHCIIRDTVMKAVKSYDLDHSLCVAWVTDNAKYMAPAAKEFGFSSESFGHLTCLAHGLNLVGKCFMEQFVDVNKLVTELNKYFKVGQPVARRNRAINLLNVPLFYLDVAPTRWNSWLRAVDALSQVWGDLEALVWDEAESNMRLLITDLLHSNRARISSCIIAVLTSALQRLTEVAEGSEFGLRSLSDLESFRLQFEAFASGNLFPENEFKVFYLAFPVTEEDSELIALDVASACQAGLSKWHNFAPMINFLHRRSLFDHHTPHSGLLCAAQLGGDIVADSELQAEWRHYCSLCPAPDIVGEEDSFWSMHEKEMPKLTRLARRFRAVPPGSSAVFRYSKTCKTRGGQK